jgi:copper oxidase (laccase) domain-containing protein
MPVFVEVSTVSDGNMYVPTNHEDQEVIATRRAWLKKNNLDIEEFTRLNISFDQDDYCRYRIVDVLNKGEGMFDGNDEPADALITTQKNHGLFLPVADCVATTLYDEEHGVLMLSHLGRHSLEQQGGVRSVAFLVEHFGTNPAKLKVWLSPAPGKQVYPIFKLDGKGMKEATFEQLYQAGVLLENIIDNPADTATDDNYFSHSEFLKGNKPTDGRVAMIAMMTD